MCQKQEDLIQLVQRGNSGCCEQNFLSRSGKVYFMDNHRAAFWCWLQHMPSDGPVTLIHIDRHTDCLGANLDEWVKCSRKVADLTLDSYLGADFFGSCLFRWDNFLSLFIRHYGTRLASLYMATREGDRPERHCFEIGADELPATLAGITSASASAGGLILDLDLDYFVARISSERHVRLYSDEYMTIVFTHLKALIKHPRCICATVAISPECCGGWTKAEEILLQFCKITGCAITLP